ncbi:hypothetical protein SLEP1_g16695 [Rubroshorea leprosula]|uniref:Receptor-like serine/threonine-protein kinase n=1 Tax=Rubroshorea leprosula TaxID=152421 RepID=A0AAV5J0I4_9ROSI|nr:hypothetical protein SLEP1_g16695 [Rubroshorea leprosula]
MATPLIILVPLIFGSSFTSSTSDSLSEGSSLSVETMDDVLTSPSGTFTAGFYSIGQNAYCFAIWFSKPFCTDCPVVWMANRDQPVNGRGSKLSLIQSGNLVLSDAGYLIVWSSNTVSASSTSLKLDDNGNLILGNSDGHVLWQSFDAPTDTLLPLQLLTKITKLVSSRSQTNFSSGFFKLYFDTDNVLRLLYEDPEVSSVYWPEPYLLSWEAGRSTYNNSRIAVLDALGNFSSTDDFTFLSADYGLKLQRRLKIDFDGNLRLYSRAEGEENWLVSWEAMSDPCMIHGSCGPNSLCSYVPASGRKCSCIPGYKMKDNTDRSLGCEPEFNLSCNQSEAGFMKLTHVEFYGYDYGFYQNYTLDMCKNLCLQICDCKGFQFKFITAHGPSGIYCYPKTQLLNGHRSVNFNGDIYLKLPKVSLDYHSNPVPDYKLECSTQVVEQLERMYPNSNENPSLRFVIWAACAIGGIELFSILFVWCFLIRAHDNSAAAHNYMLAASGFRKFTYSELKKATNGFKEEIGGGAEGIVYKGILSDRRVAAIKRLIDANQGEAEFLAEVSTIGKLNHMNLIDIWGYCAEGKHWLLVYEYMENGSLAKNLSSKTLDWKKRFNIAVGTAKGLAYLHEECLEWVLHCDIKPQNILLDSNFQPKVSDFGMSRLLKRGHLKNLGFSRMRGTRGYMAPEWVHSHPISSKVDVYSFGIVLLEMITGRNPAMGVEETDYASEKGQRTLVTWVREQMKGNEEGSRWMREIIDPILDGKYDPDEMLIMIRVALQCVQEDKDARPTMGQVIQMLLHD